jgi:hypothetical protein
LLLDNQDLIGNELDICQYDQKQRLVTTKIYTNWLRTIKPAARSNSKNQQPSISTYQTTTDKKQEMIQEKAKRIPSRLNQRHRNLPTAPSVHRSQCSRSLQLATYTTDQNDQKQDNIKHSRIYNQLNQNCQYIQLMCSLSSVIESSINGSRDIQQQ